MRLSLSLKRAWYGLILLTSFVPVLLLLLWGGSFYYNLLLDKALQQAEYFRELSTDHVNQEVSRLLTLLQNKGDPMAYTLTPGRTMDRRLLDELFSKMMGREPALDTLMLLRPEGKVIAALERHPSPAPARRYQTGGSPLATPSELAVPLAGQPYIGPVRRYHDGYLFTMAVPVGPKERPFAILLADIDANALWKPLVKHLAKVTTYPVTSYLIDKKGTLLSSDDGIPAEPGEMIDSLPIVAAFKTGRRWTPTQVYRGVRGRPVYGAIVTVKGMNWGIVAEVEQDQIVAPIRRNMFKMLVGVTAAVMPFVWLGLILVYRINRPLRALSADFARVGRQDYRPSTVSSSLKELKSLVAGFNHMVAEIDKSQRDLKRAAVVFEGTSEGIIITDSQHRIVAVNRAFTRITGYTLEEVRGKNPSLLQSGRHDEAFFQAMWQSLNETGQWQGEIWNRRKNGQIYPELLTVNVVQDKDGKTTHHVGIFSDISQIKETEYKLAHLAHHDPLTELPNRLLFHDRLEQAILRAQREGNRAAILFLDLDRFKNINDSMGHAKGDLLLQRVAERLKEAMRADDTIARLGGDEFVLIIESLKSRGNAAAVAKHILSLFRQPFCLENQEVFVDASAGISIYPDDGEDAQTLVRNADAAMYRAKAEGRNNFQFYTSELTAHATERLTLENQLRRALERDEFELYYQPQFSLKNGDGLDGVEALIRWQQSEQGLILPDRFVPVAEETGLIVPIGEWVLRTACTQHQSWVADGYRPIRMAVNLSARQFHHPDLARMVAAILEETGMPPSSLELELTESIIMRDAEGTIKMLHELSEMGIILSIDDFGTGYSSLSYMKHFPINRLKIDQSFVRDITNGKLEAEMIIPIIALGHSMKLQVLAEGVEIEEQLHYLKEQGCDEAQGYIYSRPLPPDQVTKFMVKRSGERTARQRA
ncbi:MAG TPA: EAL domain-containing protein [Gammaproteobacteria bacterium]|nr:EAL domain-containing protein [Gammaproteobacteria bacterium]